MTPTTWPVARTPWPEPATIPSNRVFDPAELDRLPVAADDFLRHALAPAASLPDRIRLRMHGQIKLGLWLPFTAEQVIDVDQGFWWEASIAGGAITGYDTLHHDEARTRFRAGPATIVDAAGPDVVRSAIGRMVGEFAAWMPGQLLPSCRVHWSQAPDGRALAFAPVAGTYHRLTLTLGPDGALRSLSYPRWGRTQHGFDWIPFGLDAFDHARFDGIAVVTRGRAGWWYGTSRWPRGEFFRFTVDQLTTER